MKRSGFLPRKTPLQTRTPIRPRKPGKRRRMDAQGNILVHVRGKERSAHFERIAALGCIACLLDGNPGTPAELHHIRETAGGGQKALDSEIVPLCVFHHKGDDHPRTPSIHLDRLRFIERYGSEMELLARVRTMTGNP